MKSKLLLSTMLLCGTMSFAQSADPVIMTINGNPVTRSEFEYSYNKNNAEGVIDKKSIDEYVPLFVNYKLKVEAAKEARLDTLTSFRQEFATYRDQQVRPALINDADIEAEARRMYTQAQQRIDGNGGLVNVAHILVMMKQKATGDEMKAAKLRIDSVYDALKRGADFATLARQVSQDPGSAAQGGQLPLIQKGQTLKEFEDQAWALKDGELSKPFQTAAGWHVILKKGQQNFPNYASQREDIYRFIDQRGLREQIITAKIDTLARQEHITAQQVVDRKRKEMEAQDPSLKYLIQEYHDGLLLYEISNKAVWEKAQQDVAGQMSYFKKNKKKYKWDKPRFKGIAYYTRDKADIAAVKKAVKRLPFEAWADRLRKTFNADSVLRIRVEKGIFKRGDNALVDKEIFRADTVAAPMEGFPYMAIFGKKLKAPKEMADVKSLVVTDYQEELEKQWVEGLRKRYQVSVNESVLKTVNKH